MASGFKDWDVPVNISGQELAEVTNRPKYGGSVGDDFSGAQVGVGELSLYTLTGKGMIYGGWLKAQDTIDGGSSFWRITLDGAAVYYGAFSAQPVFSFPGVNSSIIYCTKYDTVDHYYFFVFGRGFTFETSIAISYNNLGAGAASVDGFLFYALI